MKKAAAKPKSSKSKASDGTAFPPVPEHVASLLAELKRLGSKKRRDEMADRKSVV